MKAEYSLLGALATILKDADEAHDTIDAAKMTKVPLVLHVDGEKYIVQNNRTVGDTVIKPV